MFTYTATSWKSILHFFAIQQDGWSMNTYPIPKREFPHKLCFWLLQESYILHSCATSKSVISGTVLPPQLSAHVHLLGFSLSFSLLFKKINLIMLAFKLFQQFLKLWNVLLEAFLVSLHSYGLIDLNSIFILSWHFCLKKR